MKIENAISMGNGIPPQPPSYAPPPPSMQIEDTKEN